MARQETREGLYTPMAFVSREEKPLMSRDNETDSESSSYEESENVSFFGRLFKADINAKFAENTELATRAAFFIVVCGLPFLANGVVPALDRLVEEKVYSSGCIIYFVYTLYKTVGETVYNTVCALKGTALASINILIMFSVFPEGAQEEFSSTWWFGFFEGAFFVFILLWLNWDINTAVFAISTYVGYWMSFLYPESASNFSKSFDLSFKHQEISDFIVAAVGCGLALLATLLPYPITALSKAIKISEELTHVVPSTWDAFADYICDETANIYERDRIIALLREMQVKAGEMESHMSNSWWECFGMGTSQKVRTTLTALDIWLQESLDRLSAAWSSCVATESKWGKNHKMFMDGVQPHIKECIRLCRTLLKFCLKAACDGDVDDEEEAEMRKLIEQVEQAEMDLSVAFRQIKHAMALPNISEEFIDEYSFCLSICGFCRRVSTFAKDIINIDNMPAMVEVPGGVRELFKPDVLFDMAPTGHLNFVLRNFCSLMAGFVIGCFGFQDLLVEHSAAIACTASLLMSKALGSAVVKNMQRVQGVVLGTVVGQVLHRILGNCDWYSQLALGVVLFAYSLGNLFLYYNSVAYSFVGCLLAAFGASKMLQGCVTADFNPKATYDAIVTTVVAVFLILLMDLLFGRKRASAMTCEVLDRTWNFLVAALERNFDPKVKMTRFHRDALLGDISTTEMWGGESNMEPRYWRVPWPDKVFENTMIGTRDLRLSITAVEFITAEGFQDGAKKRPMFVTLQRLESFHTIIDIVVAKVRSVQTLTKFFSHEIHQRMKEFDLPEATREYRYEELKAVRAFLSQAAQDPTLIKPSFQGTLEEDPACQVCKMLGDLNAMMMHLRNVQHCIMQA